ncbi:xanthine dehydrogenase family protein molybdopterin-binding subunit [Chloroflexota bacterium]
MKQAFSVIGKRLPRLDTLDKATGAAKYIVDIKLPGMLVGKVLMSPYPHANILKIDKTRAEKLSGVEAIITREDVPSIKYTASLADLPTAKTPEQQPDQYIFTDKARFVGDPIAAVAAKSEAIAEEALNLINVEYEELPAVFDPRDAMKSSAPKIHNSAKNNVAIHMPFPLAQGDVEKGFRESDCIVEDTFATTKQVHCQLEPEATIASFDASGRLTVWSSNQKVHVAKRGLARIFDIPEGMIRIISPHIGGAFGGRISIIIEPICIALAKKTGKPVKIEYTKEEDFKCLETRTAHRCHIKMGFKKDGTLNSTQMKVITHAGGYLGISPGTTANVMIMGLGHYRCPNTAGEADIIYTNNTLAGAFRGFGNPAAIWGVEQLINIAAEKLGIDSIEIRLKNIKKIGEPSAMRPPIQSTALEECINVGAERIGWEEKKTRKGEDRVKKQGVGMASMSHSSSAYPILLEHSSAFIKFNADGSANLMVSPCEMGQGILSTLAQIAAEELGLYAEDIHVVSGDTDVTLFEVGTKSSRSTYVLGNAVLGAAREAKAQTLERAAKMLQVSVNELEIKDRQIYSRSNVGKRISVAEVARDALYNLKGNCLNITGKCSFEPTTVSPPTQAAFAEVEVDTETGEVKVTRLVIANDSGIAINPMTVEGQLEGGAIQSIGFALTEDFIINNKSGIVESNNFITYKIPHTVDSPEIEVVLIEKPDPAGPFGAKGLGECANVAIAPAIANAVNNAVGIRIRELPITPEKVLYALHEKNR